MEEQQTTIASLGLMTINQVEEFTTLSRATIYRLMDEGELQYVKIGKARRIPRGAVEKMIIDNLTR